MDRPCVAQPICEINHRHRPANNSEHDVPERRLWCGSRFVAAPAGAASAAERRLIFAPASRFQAPDNTPRLAPARAGYSPTASELHTTQPFLGRAGAHKGS